MVDYVLIEVVSGFAPWVFSLGHFGILVAALVLVWLAAVKIGDGDSELVFSVGIGVSVLVGLAWVVSVAFGIQVILEPEAERVAAEISSVTGVEVTAEDVQSMKNEDYIPGVNYEKMTDSDGDLVFKVEVG